MIVVEPETDPYERSKELERERRIADYVRYRRPFVVTFHQLMDGGEDMRGAFACYVRTERNRPYDVLFLCTIVDVETQKEAKKDVLDRLATISSVQIPLSVTFSFDHASALK